jgi:hypothetical protein
MQGRAVIAAGAVAMLLVGCQAKSAADQGPHGDDTAYLQAQFDALKPGDTLKLDPRVYHHSQVLTIRTPNVTIDGNGAILTATNDATSAVDVLGDDTTITNVTFTAPTQGKRWMGEQQHKLVVKGQRAAISNVTVVGSAGAGIYLSGAEHFVIHDVSIRGTRADGLHMTGGSAYGDVENIKTDQTGDDGVSVVSYNHDPAPCHDITEKNIAVGSSRARGITVVGGNNVDISHFSVANTSAAGLYVASEGDPYFTQSVDHVTMSDGSVTGANWDPSIELGAIAVYAGNVGQHVRDVSISNITVTATSPAVNRNVAIIDDMSPPADELRNISLSDIRLVNTRVAPFFTNAPDGSYTLTNWMLDGKPLEVSSI